MKNQRMTTAKGSPLNSEAPISALRPSTTPVSSFFVRSHFQVPDVDVRSWRLSVEGLVGWPRQFTYAELRRMPKTTVVATLECAGNNRTAFRVPAEGELRWGQGAVGTASWSGPSLRTVLRECRVDKSATELVFEGSDSGTVPSSPAPVRFSRALPVEKALDGKTIVALQMNGRRLTPEHGYPARLLVPGWYGMASVKWLSRIAASSGAPFNAQFNGVKYVYVRGVEGRESREPVREMRVKSVITDPTDGEEVRLGKPLVVAGKAWSGHARVASVEVKLGRGWRRAHVADTSVGRFAWTPWSIRWTPDNTGEVEIRARARDENGNVQPLEPMQNRFQYGSNAAQRLRVRVV